MTWILHSLSCELILGQEHHVRYLAESFTIAHDCDPGYRSRSQTGRAEQGGRGIEVEEEWGRGGGRGEEATVAGKQHSLALKMLEKNLPGFDPGPRSRSLAGRTPAKAAGGNEFQTWTAGGTGPAAQWC